VDNAGPQ